MIYAEVTNRERQVAIDRLVGNLSLLESHCSNVFYKAGIILILSLMTLCSCRPAGSKPTERFIDVDAGGHSLHLLVVGEAGPTVILESGWPGCGLGWDRVRGPV